MKYLFLPALLPAVSLIASVPVTAAADVHQDPHPLIVTAARTSLSSSQVGNATTVITRQDIERRQARYVTDLLRAVPGFSVSHSGGIGTQTQVRVRGAEANHVLVLIDGVRANDPAAADEFRWESLSTTSIERIEIVRGATSSLWGSDAVAAVVHIITQGKDGQNSLSAYTEAGTAGSANYGASGRFVGDQFSFTGGIERLQTDGSNVSRQGNEEDDAELNTATLGARLDASDWLSFDASVRLSDGYSQFDAVDFATGLPADSDSATKSDNALAALTAFIGTPGGRLSHRLSGDYFDSEQRNLTNGLQNSSTSAERLRIAYQADLSLGDNGASLAVEHERTDFSQRGAVSIFGDPNQDQDIDVTSLIAEYRYLAGQRLTWLLSGRFDNNSDFDDALTGRLAVVYELVPGTTLRGNLGTAQKNPTFVERFGFFPGQFIGNSKLKPEQSVSVDLGLIHEVTQRGLTVEAWLFRQKLEDEINGFVFDPNTFLFTAENDSGNSYRQGLELIAKWRPNRQFGISANYTYTDATEENAAGDEVREVRRPRHSGSLTADYLSPDERLRLALNADYGGTRLDTFFPPFPAVSELVTLDSFWLLEMTAHFNLTDTLSLYARATNLLDADYEQVFGYNTPGRAVYFGVRADFGS